MNTLKLKAGAGLQATCWSWLCIQKSYMWCLLFVDPKAIQKSENLYPFFTYGNAEGTSLSDLFMST